MKHTPGPWRTMRGPQNNFLDHVMTDTVPGLGIATTWAHNQDSEQEANARLIAAAPELLEACKVAYDAIKAQPIDSFGEGRDGELTWPIRDEILNNIAKAIAKAEGDA